MLSAQSLALCVLVCLSYARADIRTVFQKSENCFSWDNNLSSNFDKSLLTYAKCSGLFDVEDTKKCQIFHTTINADNKVASCDLTLPKDTFGVIVRPFTADKAVFISYTYKENEEQYAIKYTIVHFPDCRTNETKIYFDSYRDFGYEYMLQHRTFSVNDDNTFDVLSNHINTAMCGDKVCKWTFDVQTNEFNGPFPSSVPFVPYNNIAVKKEPSSKLYILSPIVQNNSFVIHFIKDGQYVVREWESLVQFDVSTAHGAYRICSTSGYSTKVDCELIDESGKSISMISVDMGYKIEYIHIYNLPNGEFLIKTRVKSLTYLTKVAADGKKLGTAQLPRHTVYIDESTYIEDANNEYCVTRAQVGKSLFVYKDCLGSDDLI